jgi:hypothetical protein
MERVIRSACAVLLGVAIASSSFPTTAAPEDDAKDLFARGRTLRAAGDCAAAVPIFRKAHALHPAGLGSLRNVAECEEALGHPAAARRAWLDLHRALAVVTDAKYDGWREDAAAAASRLQARVARITILVRWEIAIADRPRPRLRITLDDEPLAETLLGVPLERDPGRHVVRIEGGAKPVEEVVTLGPGEAREVLLGVEPRGEPTDRTERPAGRPVGQTVGWVALGVSGAAAVGTALAIGLRQAALSDLELVCPDYASGRCADEAARDPVDRGRRAATAANVFGAITLVGLASGLTLVLTNPTPSRSIGALQVSPFGVAGGGGALLGGRF